MMTPSDPNQPQGLTPQGLANQLFDVAVSQALAEKITDPREAARRVVGFLTDSLFYAVTSTKQDFVVFLAETLILVVSSSSGGDEAARKELLKHVGDTIANAPPIPGKAVPKP
jgi:hypothetical protein